MFSNKTRHDCFLYLYLSFAITIIGISSLFQNNNTISGVSRVVIDDVAQKSAVPKQEPDYQQQLMFLDIANNSTSSANDASSPVTSSEKTSFNEERKHGRKFVDDMDLSRQLQCGKVKCFVPSISDQKIGYLVEKNPYKEAHASQLARHVNEVANWIDREFHEGMHFHLGNSFTVHLNKTVARNFYRVTDPSTRTREQIQSQHGSQTVTVQKMKKAPDGALFFGCHMLHYKKFRRSTVPFFKKVNETGNIKEFIVNITKGYRIMEKVLEAKPDFVYDFQAMVDLNGNLYFIDLDGHFLQRNKEVNVRKYCPNGSSGPLCSKRCLRRLESNLIDDPIRNLNLTGSYKK